MMIGPAHVSLESGRVLFKPTLWGWVRGARPTRIKFEHITGLQLSEPGHGRCGRLEVRTRCAAEPFVLRFRRAQWAEVSSACNELAAGNGQSPALPALRHRR